MKDITEKESCEQSTGCGQHGELVFFAEGGEKITLEKAKELIRENEIIEIPAAGAGNFREVFFALGFEEVKVHDWTNSAGDWSFGVKNEYVWFLAWQENRYPYHGFRYCISNEVMPCNTFEDLCEEIEMM